MQAIIASKIANDASFWIEKKDAKEEKMEAEGFFSFTKSLEMSGVGSRDRHTWWRSKSANTINAYYRQPSNNLLKLDCQKGKGRLHQYQVLQIQRPNCSNFFLTLCMLQTYSEYVLRKMLQIVLCWGEKQKKELKVQSTSRKLYFFLQLGRWNCLSEIWELENVRT